MDDYVKSLPDDWRHDRLKDVAKINQNALGASTDVDYELDYLEISNVDGNGIVDRSLIEHLRFEDAPSRARRQVVEGSTIISSVRPNLQAAAYIDEHDDGLICSTGFNVVDPDVEKLIPKYLYYCLISDGAKQYFVSTAKGVGYPAIGDKEFGAVAIPLPPRPEQERIAAFLDEKCAAVDKAIEVKRKQLESVEPQWANLLHNVTLRGIRPSRLQKTTNAIIEKIPVGWKLKRLRYIGRCQNGISKDGQYFGYGFPFVTYGDVYNNMALPVVASGLVESTEEERIRYSVKRGDVFFTRTSETADEVGFSSVCLKTIPDATFAGFVIRVRPVTEDLLPEFAQYYFRNPFVSQYFAKEMMVVTRASLSQDILKSLPVLIPPRDEQAQIAQYLGERRSYFDSLSANLRKQIETLEQYRKSLIHEYVTGVRRVV
ncbi:MAG: restriction endonuclease subunit S [Kiritimatiellae bacterium]|nr:restriction endonuclease subunit S [Kiritimatiellia bacterium]